MAAILKNVLILLALGYAVVALPADPANTAESQPLRRRMCTEFSILKLNVTPVASTTLSDPTVTITSPNISSTTPLLPATLTKLYSTMTSLPPTTEGAVPSSMATSAVPNFPNGDAVNLNIIINNHFNFCIDVSMEAETVNRRINKIIQELIHLAKNTSAEISRNNASYKIIGNLEPLERALRGVKPIEAVAGPVTNATAKTTTTTTFTNTTTTENPTTTTSTVKPTTTIKPTVSPPTTTSTVKPTTTEPTTPTTSSTIKPTTTAPTTTIKPTVSPTTPATSTIHPSTTPSPTPKPDRSFDVPSFIGGIILSLGLIAIGYVVFKFYKARTDPAYRTL